MHQAKESGTHLAAGSLQKQVVVFPGPPQLPDETQIHPS